MKNNPLKFLFSVLIIGLIFNQPAFSKGSPITSSLNENDEEEVIIDINVINNDSSQHRIPTIIPIRASLINSSVKLSILWAIGDIEVFIYNLSSQTSIYYLVPSTETVYLPFQLGAGFYSIMIISQDGTAYNGFFINEL